MVEARSGHNGRKFDIVMTLYSLRYLTLPNWPCWSPDVRPAMVRPAIELLTGIAVGAEHDEHESSQNQHRCQAGQLQNVGDDRPIFPGAGIVVIAIKKHLVADIAHSVLRSLHQAQAQIFG